MAFVSCILCTYREPSDFRRYCNGSDILCMETILARLSRAEQFNNRCGSLLLENILTYLTGINQISLVQCGLALTLSILVLRSLTNEAGMGIAVRLFTVGILAIIIRELSYSPLSSGLARLCGSGRYHHNTLHYLLCEKSLSFVTFE